MTVPGLPCIVEDPTMLTNIRAFVFDSDQTVTLEWKHSCKNLLNCWDVLLDWLTTTSLKRLVRV